MTWTARTAVVGSTQVMPVDGLLMKKTNDEDDNDGATARRTTRYVANG